MVVSPTDEGDASIASGTRSVECSAVWDVFGVSSANFSVDAVCSVAVEASNSLSVTTPALTAISELAVAVSPSKVVNSRIWTVVVSASWWEDAADASEVAPSL